MRYFLFPILFCALSLQSCHSSVHHNNKAGEPVKHDGHFFDFDEIDYYNIDISEDEVMDMADQVNTSESKAMKMSILTDDIPSGITSRDTVIISLLEKYGFKKYRVGTALHEDINNVFKVKPLADVVATACVYIYRDILVFRKQGKIAGVAKICFNCWGNYITGAKANTESFGTGSDYSRLRDLLQKVKQ
jgi:hypothetical protein